MAKRLRKTKAADRGVSVPVTAKDAAVRSLPRGINRNWLWGAILVLAVVLAYVPVWQAGFVWDDSVYVVNNPCVIGPLGLKEIWTISQMGGCPLTLTAFWLEHKWWELAPLPYHLVNVFLHAACAVLLWRVLCRLQAPGAWLGAALWALHPVQAETVAWISELKNTLSGLFYLLAILFFVKWLRSRGVPSAGDFNYALTLLSALLAMAAKSSTVILPLILCLCAWWVEGRWRGRVLIRIAPLFLASIAAGLLTIWAKSSQENGIPWVRSWPERIAASGDVIWFYLGKLVWPYPLINAYPAWEIDAGQWFSYLALLAVIAVLLVFWSRRASWSRPWFFVFAYFVTALLPVLGLVPMSSSTHSLVADHLQYLAGMAPLALAGAGLALFSDFIFRERPWLKPALGAGLLLMLGTLSWHRAWAFKDDETLWSDAVAKNPGCWVAYNNLGLALAQDGKLDQAVAAYQQALKIEPGYAGAHNNLGGIFLQQGRTDEARAQFQEALKDYPPYAKAENNLGIALSQEGRTEDAILHYQNALKIDPAFADAHNNLGSSLTQEGELDEAITHYQKALEINPGFAEAHFNLGNALARERRMDEAIAQFQEALRIDPGFAAAQTNLNQAQSLARQMGQ
ncbi:MAG TPA: tetratricopeptide repeat protein [Candidatus Methylacidiphilales bacterium]|nr:tetratricopeptide repeat protein [Candidatus Methylacidiphilales bacterium]